MALNLQKLKSTHEFDDDFMGVLIGSFITETTECLGMVESFHQSGDLKRLKGAAHKMLGSCHVFELTEMIEILRSIEIDAENQKNLETMAGRITQLKNIHNQVVAELKKYAASLTS